MVGNTEKTHDGYPVPGDVVSDRYRVLSELGAGGMGRVLLAEHVIIGKRVALKVLAPELARDPTLSARFLQEARIASQIRHENVVDINDFGTTPRGLAYFVMDYLEGTDLDALVRVHGCLPWLRARNIIRQVCAALKAAHDLGIVHRDMKPENVFVSATPEERVTVLDFGIAKVAASTIYGGDGPEPAVTREGTVLGTPAYMSPEQAQGLPVDLRTDVYATGCLLFYLLTGRTPFEAPTHLLMLNRHLTEAPQLPSMVRPDAAIPEVADLLIMKALAKDPAKRWSDMSAFLAALEATEQDNHELAFGRSTLDGQIHVSESQAVAPPAVVAAPKIDSSAPAKKRPVVVPIALVAVGVMAAALVGRWLAHGKATDPLLSPRTLAATAPDGAAPMRPDTGPVGGPPDGARTLPAAPMPEAPKAESNIPSSPRKAAPVGKSVLPKREARRRARPVFEPLVDPEAQ